MKQARCALAGLVLAAAGAMFGWAWAGETPPHCPTEDSCRADYEDGRYTIIEVTP
jgi:hypothetical protein